MSNIPIESEQTIKILFIRGKCPLELLDIVNEKGYKIK